MLLNTLNLPGYVSVVADAAGLKEFVHRIVALKGSYQDPHFAIRRINRMRIINRVLPFLTLILLYPVFCTAQTPAKDSSASISGRVTVGGKAAAGITVVATVSNSFFDNKTVTKTTTDEDGKYNISGLPAGRFTVLPLAKYFLVAIVEASIEVGQG